MRIHFELTGSDGSVLAAGRDATQTIDLASWDNHSAVVRLLHARGLPTRMGHRLAMWVELEQPVPIFPDETIDRAAEAFHQAVGPHLDTAGAACSRSRDWVDAPVVEVVEALLLHGWVPPLEDGGEADEPEWPGEGQRAVPGRRGVLTLCWSRGRRRD